MNKLPEVYHYIGRIKYEKKKYTEAIQEFTKILAMQKVEDEWIKPWTHYVLGNCYKQMGDTNKAKVEYDIAYEYDDSDLRFQIDRVKDHS